MSGFRMDTGALTRGLAERELRTKAALGLYANTVAMKMESHAKTNYNWTPRSGAAHQRITGTWKWQGNKARVELSHGVDYGVYLEFANEKQYAVLKPSIDYITPTAIRGLSNIIR